MHDPFTLSVIQAGFENAAEEMFAVLRKTAMSPIIYEVLDVGTGITEVLPSCFRLKRRLEDDDEYTDQYASPKRLSLPS